MGIILSVIFLCIAYGSYVYSKKKITPVVIFSLLWSVILFFEGLHLFGLYQSALLTYAVIAIGVMAFALGSLCFRRIVIMGLASRSEYYSIKMSWYYILMILTIWLLYRPMMQNLSGVLLGTIRMDAIRSSFENIYSSAIMSLLYNYLALPCSIACLPITALILVTEEDTKAKWTSFVLTIIVIVQRIFIDAGRGIMLYFFVVLFFAYKLFGKSNGFHITRAKRKSKKIVYLVFVTVVVAYVALTVARGGKPSELLKQVYVYLCGCVPFLDKNLQVVNQEGNWLFGAGGLHGPLQFVYTMLENFGILKYPTFMTTSDFWYNNSLVVRNIAPLTQFNAYATAFYNVYLDGGIIAVFIEMFLYGGFSRSIYNITQSKPNNLRMKCVYLFVIYGLVFSFIRFQLSLTRNFICFILIFIIVGRKRSPHENCAN